MNLTADDDLIVPTLRVGMHPSSLRVGFRGDAERPGRHPHAERGADQINPKVLFVRHRLRALMNVPDHPALPRMTRGKAHVE